VLQIPNIQATALQLNMMENMHIHSVDANAHGLMVEM
jgi:hypothetical protein